MDPLPPALELAVQDRLRNRGVYGLALCAFDREGVRFGGGVGYADVARGEPVATSTIFRVASISKLLTTTLVLKLVDAGVVDLDAACAASGGRPLARCRHGVAMMQTPCRQRCRRNQR